MYTNILLPLDSSSASQKAAKECVQIAKRLGASIRALHIVRPPFFYEDETPWDFRAAVEEHFEALTEGGTHGSLSELQRYAIDSGVDWTTTAVLGLKPCKEIVDHATRTGCDLIVMASHRRSSVLAWWYGSQTMDVLSHCDIPVLVLRYG